jgi:hypothetical protein
MTDSAEREANLNNTIIIFSVTLEANEFNKLIKGSNKMMGFGKTEEEVEKIPKKAIGNIVGEDIMSICDEVLLFNELQTEDLQKIYNLNLDYYLGMYNVDIDKKELHKLVMSESKNGHNIISKLSSEIPRLVFRKLSEKEKEYDKVNISKINRKNDSNSKKKRLERSQNSESH